MVYFSFSLGLKQFHISKEISKFPEKRNHQHIFGTHSQNFKFKHREHSTTFSFFNDKKNLFKVRCSFEWDKRTLFKNWWKTPTQKRNNNKSSTKNYNAWYAIENGKLQIKCSLLGSVRPSKNTLSVCYGKTDKTEYKNEMLFQLYIHGVWLWLTSALVVLCLSLCHRRVLVKQMISVARVYFIRIGISKRLFMLMLLGVCVLSNALFCVLCWAVLRCVAVCVVVSSYANDSVWYKVIAIYAHMRTFCV